MESMFATMMMPMSCMSMMMCGSSCVPLSGSVWLQM